MTLFEDRTFVLCPCCGSEGFRYSGHYDDERCLGVCEECEGTGIALIECEPAERDDDR